MNVRKVSNSSFPRRIRTHRQSLVVASGPNPRAPPRCRSSFCQSDQQLTSFLPFERVLLKQKQIHRQFLSHLFFFFYKSYIIESLEYVSTQHFHIRSPLFFDYERAGLLFLKTLYRSTYFSYFRLIVKISDPLYRVHELCNNNPVKFFQLRIFINK